jgi:uncharacterized protein
LIFKERAEKQVERPASRVGRHIEIPIHPLVYPEFLEFSGLVDADEAWGRFLLQGGMPGIHAISKEDKVVFEYLGAVADTVVLKGVIQRHAIRNPRLLQQLLHFVLDTSGSPLSAKRIADYLKSQNIRCSVDTILEYLAFFVDARMVSRISRHDLRGKRVLEVHEKYYAAGSWASKCDSRSPGAGYWHSA